MRVAIISDIHGNDTALEAVLTDIQARGGVDQYWILGDLAAIGPSPVAVLQRLSELPNAHFVRGNTDRYVCTGDRPPPSFAETAANPELVPVLSEVAGTFAWTQGAINQGGWFDWLSALPLEMSFMLPDGTKVLGVHASPGQDDGQGVKISMRKAEFVAMVENCDADLILVGHRHRPMDVTVGLKRVVNAGSVSNPSAPDLRACYALLVADEKGYNIEHHRADYDREKVIALLEQQRHPGAKFIISHLRGER
ncbi:MAG: metallophosphoesterase family protein [Chloroflexota bacterium]